MPFEELPFTRWLAAPGWWGGPQPVHTRVATVLVFLRRTCGLHCRGAVAVSGALGAAGAGRL